MHPEPRLLMLVVFVIAGCTPGGAKYDDAIANAVQNQSDVKAFVKLFPDSEHFITYYTGAAGPRVWNSHVLIHGRYVLTMQFDMALDASGVKVSATAPPEYYLSEITSVTVMPNGQVNIFYGESAQFGPADWKKLEASGGGLSVPGITVKRDRPVPNLAAQWRGA